MRKQLICKINEKILNVAWLSFQHDGSISFGLNDRTFVTPNAMGSFNIFNSYNRIRSEFIVSKDGAGLEPIHNPHFTYHPIALFHLVGKDKAGKKKEIFSGIADTTIIFSQQTELPWIRATTRKVADINNSGIRLEGIDTEILEIPIKENNVSLKVTLDLLKPAPYSFNKSVILCKAIPWHDIIVYLGVETAAPQESTLSWFYEY